MATVQIRVDDALKARVDSLYNSLGMDTTTAVRMFFMASLEHDGIPFEVRHAPDHSLAAALRDSRGRRNLFGPYDTAQAAVDAMLED